ncbi:MAG: hypothetical protein KGJ78_02870 [Alphaproteobacteria bacterium]|nr:hypothetical protein [Alphaproteobacteria bacterium]
MWRWTWRRVCRWVAGRSRGNVAIMFALMAPMLIGGLGLGVETSLWYAKQRDLQNAADAAASAAAGDASSNYTVVADAVAASYGYQNGVGGVTVTASNAAACPAGGNACYSVTIAYKQQLYLLPVVGFRGDTTLQGQPAQTLQATATATPSQNIHDYCLLTLATTGTALRTNGAPKANLAGCDVMSNADATCNGHNLGADYGDAAGADNGCGVVQTSNVPVVSDPYAALASNIPADPCSSYPQEPAKKKDPPLPASNQWSGSVSWSGTKIICGDLQLTDDVTLDGGPGSVLVIENGQLDTGNYTIQTASGTTATIIFSGTSGSYTHAPTGSGTIDIQAPTSGTWSGVALYQDPSLTSGVDISAAGNSPTWDITGLVYLPHANVTFSGAVNKSSNGASCFVLVSYTLLINGTADILAHGGCTQAGLGMPSNTLGSRGQLVN